MRVDREFGAPNEVRNREWKRAEWEPAVETLRRRDLEASLNTPRAWAREDARKIADTCHE